MRVRASILVVFLLAACGEAFSGTPDMNEGGSGGSGASGGDLSTTPCTPGRSLACVGKGQCDGFQECNAKGTGYGVCRCEGAAGGAPGSDGGAPSSGSGGSAPGSAGEGNSAGAPTPSEPPTSYVYWTNGMFSLIQTLDATTGEVTASKQLPAPAPNATPAWGMRSFVPLADGGGRALWTRSAGEAELWTLNAGLNKQAATVYANPEAGSFFASAYRRLPDGSGRIVWHDLSTEVTRVWPLSQQDVFLEEVLAYDPVEEGTWLPVHYTTMPDGRGLLLWAGVITGVGPSGKAEIWVLPNDEAPPGSLHVIHSMERWARSLTMDPDGSVRIGLGSNIDGQGFVCGLGELAAGTVTVPEAEGWGVGKCKHYTQSGMQFRGYVAGWQ